MNILGNVKKALLKFCLRNKLLLLYNEIPLKTLKSQLFVGAFVPPNVHNRMTIISSIQYLHSVLKEQAVYLLCVAFKSCFIHVPLCSCPSALCKRLCM